MDLDIDKPNPVPLDKGFVLKNGSNMLCISSFGIPLPLSEIEITATSFAESCSWLFSDVRAMVIKPLFSTKSTALLSMLMITCSSLARSNSNKGNCDGTFFLSATCLDLNLDNDPTELV